jgi:hypothetical protein
VDPYEDPPTVDFTPEYGPPRQVETKLVVASTLAGVLWVVADAVQTNTQILDGLPPWVRSLILALIPTMLAFAAGYRVPSNRV